MNILKFLFIMTLVVTAASPTQAQTWNEWFKQKKTQKKYLRKQIVLLQAHLKLLKDGYQLVRRGMTTIHNVQQGDVHVHRDFFAHLSNVNPAIADMAKVADIIAFQTFIITQARHLYHSSQSTRHLTPREIYYISEVCLNLVKLTNASLDELYMIITSGKTSMTDDARIDRVNTLYEEARDRKAFLTAFHDDVLTISQTRDHQIAAYKSQTNLVK